MSASDRSPAGPASVVDAAITSRRSIRAFLPEPVPRATIEDILRVASRAPSGTNAQPWNVHVLTGAALRRLSDAILAVYRDPAQLANQKEEYSYYPEKWVEPYLGRRRKVGWDLYGLLGIGRADKDRIRAQHGRNYRFFDAPVGLIFSIERVMAKGSWLDFGMFLENIMVAARARGLDTCPQAAFNQFHAVIRTQLGIGADRAIVCGMSLGKADMSRIENTLVTEREPIEHFVHFRSE
ncbi:Nitroreductase [Burkholderiales bacterium]|jgi:nitroreductase|nr:Nitroreductase [Burkholderiales bacterium]